MKKKSVIRKALQLMIVHLILLLIVFFSYLLLSYNITVDNLADSTKNLIQIYGKDLENKLQNTDMLLERLIYRNIDYDLLESENEATRHYAAVRLRNLIEEQVAYDEYVDSVIIADSTYGICLDYENRQISLEDKNQLRSFSHEQAALGKMKAEWNIRKIGSKSYVYKMYVWHGKAVGVFISSDQFMKNVVNSDLGKMTVLLLDQDDVIWGTFGEQIKMAQIGEKWEGPEGYRIQGSGCELGEGKLHIYAFVGMSEILGQIQLNMILVLTVLLSLVLFSIVLLRFVRRELIIPISHMQATMQKIQEGDYMLRMEKEYGSSEFTLLKDTFNRVMEENVHLRIERYEKQIDLQETELKCVRLQIRPHFFLNAMATISSLSQSRKNREIQGYINALSKNIRYMFRSGLHTVTLGEEIRHIENYFEMQELNYPNCVFYYIDIPEELKSWRIPQMLIHTIIENEYKYAVAVDQILTILIRAEKVERNGQEMLYLEIEDDGGGYPESVLKDFLKDEADGEAERTPTGERIGLKSVRRILELMYEQENLFQIDNTVPHGCQNRFWIPKEAMHEIGAQE